MNTMRPSLQLRSTPTSKEISKVIPISNIQHPRFLFNVSSFHRMFPLSTFRFINLPYFLFLILIFVIFVGILIATGGRDGCLKFWDVKKQLLCELPLTAALNAICFLPNGDILFGERQVTFTINFYCSIFLSLTFLHHTLNVIILFLLFNLFVFSPYP